MKRRTFLKASSFVSLPLLVNGLPVSALGNYYYNQEGNDNILVLIQLNGGNDGLNTIIPIDQYKVLTESRSNVLIPENRLIKIKDNLGFHPSMTAMKDLYDQGKMSVLQNVSYPDQNRSHFRSTDIWTSGSPSDEFWTTGWLGRYFEQDHDKFPTGYPNNEYPDPIALAIGSNVSETCQGTIANFSMAISDPNSLGSLSGAGFDETPENYYGEELKFLRTSFDQANEYGQAIKKAADKGANMSALYNANDSLMQQLKTIALLISGGIQTKVFIANLGGFDTHANQVNTGDTITGDHATLLSRLSTSIRAFQDDLRLQGLEKKVLTMTFSEFGRRIRSNASLGTDHGSAAPMMFFGSCINSGIIGTNPQLPLEPGPQDGVAMEFDFRNVYGSILIDWLGMNESQAQDLLPEGFTKLPIVQSCNTTPTNEILNDLYLDVALYPNPTDAELNIKLTPKSDKLRIGIYDALGYEVYSQEERTSIGFEQNFKIDFRNYPSGNYFCRFLSGTSQATKVFVKI